MNIEQIKKNKLAVGSFLDIVKSRKGNVLLTGGTGTGKSTLIEQLRNEPQSHFFNFETNPLNEKNFGKLNIPLTHNNIIVIDYVDTELLYSEKLITLLKESHKKGNRFIIVAFRGVAPGFPVNYFFNTHIEAVREGLREDREFTINLI
ncbi:hypothetical protein DYG63_20510 [Yersinia enterocolitica]|nr:hypothetical protein [Yersinia enterocolitica]